MKQYITTILLVIAGFCACNATTLSQQGDSAYNKKDFVTAVKLYNQSLATEGVSPIAYYNLGNAYYRIGNMGHAILNYERALALDPSFGPAKANLQFVNSRIPDKPEDDSSFLGNLQNKIISQMSPNAWAITALAMFTLLLCLIACYIFSSNVGIRKTGFFGSIVVIFLFIYVSINAWQSSHGFFAHDTAIVTVPTANLTSAPAQSNTSKDKVVPIHEGTKVFIIDSLATPDDPAASMWYNVKINNSAEAWVRAADVTKI